ncbi:hypothetical protein BPOR_0154g00080 [Botrytis porri]|uniref:Uncharacterized protein n=1 Tax=Botrytis porri TaxID=87229 RepID=A0A4Z1KVL2_9HELO|nr:hypothetical protein BPOR_0154g00080 [Botrytis porri]
MDRKVDEFEVKIQNQGEIVKRDMWVAACLNRIKRYLRCGVSSNRRSGKSSTLLPATNRRIVEVHTIVWFLTTSQTFGILLDGPAFPMLRGLRFTYGSLQKEVSRSIDRNNEYHVQRALISIPALSGSGTV